MARVVASPLTRWKVAAASVAVHLCLGSVYAWSVFVKPLQEQFGCGKAALTSVFSLAIVMLGLSAAFGGGWMERRGARKSVMLAGLFFGGGVMLAGGAVAWRSLPLLYVSYGLLGGIGLGLGYLMPVSTLIKWFPDRRGLATGMAVFGFGAGALIAAPLARFLMDSWSLPAAFVALGLAYLLVMPLAAQVLAAPPAGYRPLALANSKTKLPANQHNIELRDALRTRKFWLIWAVFFINISVGITLISQASPMAQEMAGLSAVQAGVLVGLMGIFNGAGRIAWSSASDYMGRTRTFSLMLGLQALLLLSLAHSPNAFLYQCSFLVILTCYGGGFSTCPAFIADQFGARTAGAIYGVTLTAWSLAGIAGPLLGALLREQTKGYTFMLYPLTGVLLMAIVFTEMIARKNTHPPSPLRVH